MIKGINNIVKKNKPIKSSVVADVALGIFSIDTVVVFLFHVLLLFLPFVLYRVLLFLPKSSIPHSPVQLALLYFLYQAKDFFSLGSTPTCSVKAQILLSISSHLLHVSFFVFFFYYFIVLCH